MLVTQGGRSVQQGQVAFIESTAEPSDSKAMPEQATEAGITPIEVMLTAMRDFWAQGTPEAKREAAIIARHAASCVRKLSMNFRQRISPTYGAPWGRCGCPFCRGEPSGR